MFNNVFSKEANPILVNFWRTLPASLYNEAINSLKIWCENNEISFAFKDDIDEAPCNEGIQKLRHFGYMIPGLTA